MERESLSEYQLAELRKAIDVGLAEADRGQVAPLHAMETLARVRQNRTENK